MPGTGEHSRPGFYSHGASGLAGETGMHKEGKVRTLGSVNRGPN